jgi:hypothetical protein
LDFTLGYVIFGGMFVGAAVAYWVVTWSLRDPKALYAQLPEATT